MQNLRLGVLDFRDELRRIFGKIDKLLSVGYNRIMKKSRKLKVNLKDRKAEIDEESHA